MSQDLSLNALRGDVGSGWIKHPVPSNVTDPETFKAAQGFEAYFARYLVNQLKGEMNLIGGKGYGGDVFQELYVDAISGQIASSGALGITDMIYRQLSMQKGQEPYLDNGQQIKPLNLDLPDRTNLPVSREMARFDSFVLDAARANGLEPELIYAVMQQESGGDPNAVSHAGAKGLMQLIDSTAAEVGVSDSFDPRQNIHGGARYLKIQLDDFGDLEHALAAYNAGPGAVKRHAGIPPYKETQQYVRNVTAIYERLRNHAEVSHPVENVGTVPDLAQNRAAARDVMRGVGRDEG